MSTFELLQTEDGSRTLFVPELNETYHSRKGALHEARHVFINNGLDQVMARKAEKISVLEVGFGTGLNALLSFLHLSGSSVHLWYDGLEKHPLPAEVMYQMDYSNAIDNPQAKAVFSAMVETKWNESIEISSGHFLRKLHADLHQISFDRSYDLIYFDAFCFRAQEDMWSKKVFDTLYNHCNPQGILVTYASKGLVRRTLTESGFLVEKLPGPTGKREMLRAIKEK